MLNSFKHNIYMTSMMIGTLMAISSASWFTAWLGLEINLMSLIPLLIYKINPHSTESTIKYFITQAMASMMIIFSSVYIFFSSPSNLFQMSNFLIILALAIKMGAAPFHFWLPQVVSSANWFNSSIILTWQKIAPMLLLSNAKHSCLKLIIIASCLIGAIGAFNQTDIKKIIVYSSILHSAWLLMILGASKIIWTLYFSVYSLILLALILPLFYSKISSINEIFYFQPNSLTSLLTFLNFLSLAGIPPFTGFFLKLSVLIYLMSFNPEFLMIFILIVSSLTTLYYYLRMMYSSLISTLNFFKLTLMSWPTTFLASFMLTLSTLSNFLAPLFLTLYKF